MSVAISWDNKMQLAKCDITVGFPISSHIYTRLWESIHMGMEYVLSMV